MSRAFPAVLLLAVGAASGCRAASSEGVPDPLAGPNVCASCAVAAAPVVRGALPGPVDELSGLVASRAHRGVYWGHNDQGNRTEVFAFHTDGRLRSRHTLVATACTDCEDITLAPCPAGSCLVLADAGDNDDNREEYALLRFPEPDPDQGDGVTGPVERFPFAYPDGSHNSEALVASPDGDHVWLILKQPSQGRSPAVYRVGPLSSPGVRLTAQRVDDLDLPGDAGPVTAVSLHPCAPALLLRTTAGLWQVAAAPGAAFDAVWTAPARALVVAAEMRGEAIAWRADGAGYVTAGEGKGEAISEVGCR